MFNSLRKRLIVAATLVVCSALAADVGIDVAKSTIVATFKQEGVSVDAPFKRFSGQLVYDPANVAKASASMTIETGTLDIGDEAYNAEVRKKSWFDSATYPKATFRSTAIKAGAAGHFDATGALTIKGRVLTITVPVTVKKSGAVTLYDGTLTISRKAFDIGDPIWNDVIDDKVMVKFHLVN